MQLAEELSLLAEDCKDHLIPSYLAEELASALVYYKTKQAEAKRVSDRKVENLHKAWHAQELWPGLPREDIMFLLQSS